MWRIKLTDGSFTTLESKRVIGARVCPDWDNPGSIVFKIDILRSDGKIGSRTIFPDNTVTPEIITALKLSGRDKILIRITRFDEKKYYCEPAEIL